MSHWPIELIHISLVRAGDVVLHHEKERTVCHKDLTKDTFFGPKLFGDSYNLGLASVKRLKIERAMP